jgi:phage terminase large subunit-like protein
VASGNVISAKPRVRNPQDPLSRAADRLTDIATDPRRAWRATARADQVLPPEPWRTLVLLGGRGSGKTRAGAQGLAEMILGDPEPGEWGIVAPTYRDAWATCVEGESGLLVALGTTMAKVRAGDCPIVASAARGYAEVRMRNGHVIRADSADDGALRIQGKNLKGVWLDELGLFAKWETAFDESIAYAVRKGSSKIIATGTPKVSRPAAKLIRRLTKESQTDPTVIVRRLRTTDNLANLSETFFRSVVARSKGTRLERQELEGELLEDNDQALWSRETIERNRVEPEDVPDLIRVVVALDPAVTSLTSADETGIIVAGEAATGHGYILADLSLRASPQRAMERAVAAYHQFNGDRIIGEANNGGDFIGALLKTVDPDIAYTKVTASRGKAVRAEPVSALYEQGRIHHAGVFVELEDELCTWAPGDSDSPDRLDACVWAVSALRGLSRGSWADAYGIVTCVSERCGRGYLSEGRKACPHCGTPKPEESAA